MKKIYFLLITAVVFIACNSPEKGANGVIYKTPMEYNDYIISRQTTMLEKIMNFSNAAQVDLDSAGKLLDGYVLDASKIINEIKGMPAFRKDTVFRQAAVNSFMFYRKAFDDYYRDIIRIKIEDAADADAQLEKVLTNLTTEEEKVDKRFHNAQEDFAKKNKMKLIDNDMQKKIDEMD